MPGCSDKKNPLVRSASGQQQRRLSALNAHYADVDEKKYADWIVFAGEFSTYINYYDTSGAKTSDWKPFFSKDISAILGVVALQDIDSYRRSLKERFDYLKDDHNVINTNTVEKKLNELFSCIFSLSKAMDDFVLTLPKELDLKNTLQNLIKTKQAPSLERLLAYYKGASDLHFLHVTEFANWKIMNKPVVDASVIIDHEGLSDLWFSKDNTINSWEAFRDSIPGDKSIFGDTNLIDFFQGTYADNPSSDYTIAEWTEYMQINHAAHHNLFTSIFDQFISGYTKFITESEKQLLLTLDNWNTHPPHYALFITFLKLFRTAQQDINTLTQRHLDYYYKEILRLLPKEATPNQAHILVEPAKQVDEYALGRDTLLKAGKDSEGKEVLYSFQKDEVFNKAKVVKLMSVYKGQLSAIENDNITGVNGNLLKNNQGRLFASPIANSEDGLGTALIGESKEWHPFVNKVYTNGKLSDINMPVAQIGFAIASHYLFLNEGERKITLRLATDQNKTLHAKNIECYLTTQKDWYKPDNQVFFNSSGKFLSDNITPCAELEFTISANAPAIVGYSAVVHGGTMNTILPVLKIILVNNQAVPGQYQYNQLKDTTIDKVEIKVDVGEYTDTKWNQKGIKQLLLSNDFGPLNGAKPFMPFGAQPQKDNSFVIGSKELFCKKNAALKLHIEWANYPAATDNIDYERKYSYVYENGKFKKYTLAANEGEPAPLVKAQYYAGGKWQSDIDKEAMGDINILSAAALNKPFIDNTKKKLPPSFFIDFEDEYTNFDIATRKGFIRLLLKNDFGHKKYLSDLTQYLIEKGNIDPKLVPQEPIEPYTPVTQSIYLSYTANTIINLKDSNEIAFNNRDIRFFHIYPFGDGEQHKFLGNKKIFVVPHFAHNVGTIDNNAEFYIGLQNLSGLQSVNILFQMQEGSTNPLLEKPPKHITWSYLSRNTWIDFDGQHISDATMQLVQSGIITFTIPQNATTDNTILPTGYLWIKAGIVNAAEAICKLFSVDAQATAVIFSSHENAADFLDTALPAEKISKLKIPDAAVKKILQPYSTFGGRTKENDEHFYIRVSERLRHKARAITIWDYEHIVLEAYPDIHKVKCLNHTQLEEGVYNEVQPGYVSIITVPSLVNRNDANPLKPYTAQNKLMEIEEYLKKKVSCQVKVRVRNPQFEEVRIEFKLKLASGFTDFTFYSATLQKEITQFLTPWVFNNNAEIEFGGKIYKSSLINFIEERNYVEYITEVKLFHKPGDTAIESGNLEEITASTARSILVSAPESKHIISPA